MVYEKCKFYGPYSSKDKRLRCILIHEDGKRQTISYPKYLMEVHLNRYLEENETIVPNKYQVKSAHFEKNDVEAG